MNARTIRDCVLAGGLPCPDCGYDMRAAGGDPVCCPECGFTCAADELAPQVFQRFLESLPGAPFEMIGLGWLMFVACVFALGPPVFIVLPLACLVLLVVAFIGFGSRVFWSRGWWAVPLGYLWAFAIGPIALSAAVVCIMMIIIAWTNSENWGQTGLLGGLLCMVFVVMGLGAIPAYRNALRRMDRIREDLLTELAAAMGLDRDAVDWGRLFPTGFDDDAGGPTSERGNRNADV